jgi:SRSO17 transposase
MLVFSRITMSNEAVETAPLLNLKAEDVEGLLEALEAYHRIYGPLFGRREQREWSKKYLMGLLMELPRKSVEPMVLAIEGANEKAVRAMQQFISEGAWTDEVLLGQHWREVNKDLGEPMGVLTLDGSDFHKQGKESVGVKRQYCGELGKRANCQAGVFVGYSSSRGYALLDRRLYLPHEWLENEEYAERRAKCGIPSTLTFKTKIELGLDMLTTIQEAKTLRAQWVMCDEGFGRDGAFLDRVAKLDLWYFAEVPHDTRVWRDRPTVGLPAPSATGRKPTKARAEPTPETVLAIADQLRPEQWTRHTIKEGSKGPLIADFAVLRVVAVRDALPGPDAWLVIRRSVSTGELKTYLSNAPAELPMDTLVWATGMRWPIESCFEDGKQYVGLGDYEIRSWRGWHHHMTLCILAHFFLVRLAVSLKKVTPTHHPSSSDAFAPDVANVSLISPAQPGPRLLLATPQLARLSLPSQTSCCHVWPPTKSVSRPELNVASAHEVSL